MALNQRPQYDQNLLILPTKGLVKLLMDKNRKSSSKSRLQSSEKGHQLMPEIMTSGQIKHDEHHLSKLMGVKDIHQTDISSSPDAITKFGLQKVA